MLGHFLGRDVRDFAIWWVGLGLITAGVLAARWLLPWRPGLEVLLWAYVMFAYLSSGQVLGSVWRTQHQWSRHYLLSLPVSHRRLFIIRL